jgi:hypothetical protein
MKISFAKACPEAEPKDLNLRKARSKISIQESYQMNEQIRKLKGANMDIDLATPQGNIAWEQDNCPWNGVEQTSVHKCAIKNVSICPYFCGVEYLDTLLCCYPHQNPLAKNN